MATFLKQGFCYQEKKIQIIFAKWRKFDTKKSLTSAALQNWKKKTPSFLEASYRRCPFDTVAQLGRHEASCGRCPFDAVINLVDRKGCPFAAVVNLVVTKHLAQQSYHAKEREREREEERAGVWGRAENYAMQKRKVGIQAETFTHQKAPVFERARHGFYDLAVCDRQAHVPLSRTSRGLRVGIVLKAKASKRPVPPSSPPGSSQTHKQTFLCFFLGGFYSVAGWKRRSGVAASSFSCWVVSPWEKKNKQ